MTTITWAELRGLAPKLDDAELASIATAFGFTIADPSPPEARVKLAMELAMSVPCRNGYERIAAKKGALAALQHFEKLVRDAQHEHAGHYAGLREGVIIDRVIKAILSHIGAEQ